VSEVRDPYLLADLPVLRNKLGLKDAASLDRHERRLVAQRIRQGAPQGSFDLTHLRAIHRHLFQDIYHWAGDVRTVNLSKDGSHFLNCRHIDTGIGDIRRRLLKSRFLRRLNADAFAIEAGEIMGDLNYVHPFRDGNGRTQLLYLKQLAAQAGHDLDLTALNREHGAWIEASIAAHGTDYEPMRVLIRRAITGPSRSAG